MKLTDLIVSPKSLGDKLWLVDVSPAYEYKDGKRTDTVLGYRYSVALPEKGLDKVDVRIDGQQQAEAPESGYSLSVEILADAVQSSPSHAVSQAWAVTAGADGMLQAS